MAGKNDEDVIDLGGFSSSDEDDNESDVKKADISPSTPRSRSSKSSHSLHANSNRDTKQHQSSMTSTRSQSQSLILTDDVNQKLSDFYGTPQQRSPQSNAGKNSMNRSRENTPSMSGDELRYDFKSKHFSADKFVEKKVSDMTVNELVNYSNELNHGVKALDSEMQMMVYDNYSKFISATDTIRKMKDQVENMEMEMSKLLNNMNNIATNCSEIENRFKSNRSEIEKLVSVRGLLKKLSFLFELPNRLKKNIELGDYWRAVRYFKMATKILSSYKHIPSFNRISIESVEIINDLQENLKKQMVQKNITSHKQLEIAKLLLSLNQQPQLLWYDIFKTRKDSLKAIIIKLKTAEKVRNYYHSQQMNIDKNEKLMDNKTNNEIKQEELDDTNPFQTKVVDETNPFHAAINEQDKEEKDKKEEDKKNNNNNKDRSAFFSVINYFQINFLSLFEEFVVEYKSVFIEPFECDKNDIHDKKKKDSSSSSTIYESSLAALTSFTRDIFFEYFNVIKLCLQRELNIDKLTEELEAFYNGLYHPSKLVPNAKLKDRGTEIIESCIRTSMEREFISTQQKQLNFLVNYMRDKYDINNIIINSDEYNITNNEYHIKKCVNKIKIFGIDCLNHLIPLTTNQSKLINILDLNFDDQLWSYTANIFKIFNQIIPCELRMDNMDNMDIYTDNQQEIFIKSIYNKIYNKLQPIKLLILSKIFIGIANNVVSEIIKHFKKNYLYDRDNKNGSISSSSLGIYKQEVLLFKKYCNECSNGLRLMYSQRISYDIIELIDKLESDHINDRQPIIDDITQKINNCIKNMCKIYNISSDSMNCHIIHSSNQQNTENARDGGLKHDNLREYDKLFNEGCLIYDKVNDNSNTVLFAIYKIIFKHWSEILRLKIINKKKLNNIYQNIKYFRNNIPKIIEKKDFSKLQTLLDEIQQSAKERCIVVMDNNNNDNNDNHDTLDID